jgi:hypothetical protein
MPWIKRLRNGVDATHMSASLALYRCIACRTDCSLVWGKRVRCQSGRVAFGVKSWLLSCYPITAATRRGTARSKGPAVQAKEKNVLLVRVFQGNLVLRIGRRRLGRHGGALGPRHRFPGDHARAAAALAGLYIGFARGRRHRRRLRGLGSLLVAAYRGSQRAPPRPALALARVRDAAASWRAYHDVGHRVVGGHISSPARPTARPQSARCRACMCACVCLFFKMLCVRFGGTLSRVPVIAGLILVASSAAAAAISLCANEHAQSRRSIEVRAARYSRS